MRGRFESAVLIVDEHAVARCAMADGPVEQHDGNAVVFEQSHMRVVHGPGRIENHAVDALFDQHADIRLFGL
jgi:hypothetical protein